MALNLDTFKTNLIDDVLKAEKKNMPPLKSDEESILKKSLKEVTDAIANRVDAYIKTATITFPTKSINVQGSPSAQSNTAPIILDKGIS